MNAKREEFRQQIRRRQIESYFKTKRYHQVFNHSIHLTVNKQSSYNPQQLLQQFHTLLFELQKAVNEADSFRILSNLRDLSHFIFSHQTKKHLLTEIWKTQLLQVLTGGLGTFNDQTNDGTRQEICISAFSLLHKIIQNEEHLDSERVFKSHLIPQISINLKYPFYNQKFAKNIFLLVGNLVVLGKDLLEEVQQNKIPEAFIFLIYRIKPELHEEAVQYFVFFFKSYLQEEGGLKYGTQLTKDQSEVLFNVSHGCILLYETYGFQNEEVNVLMEDSVIMLKCLIEFQFIEYKKAPIHYGKILDMVMINQCPFEIKRNILILLDTIVFMDEDSKLTDDLVRMYSLTDKIWGVDEEIKHITMNILANVVLDQQLKPLVNKYMNSILLQLHYEKRSKELFRFVLNYFYSQNFKIQSRTDETLVTRLSSVEETCKEIEQIEVEIWLGLVHQGYKGIIPRRIEMLENNELAQSLRYIRQNQIHI